MNNNYGFVRTNFGSSHLVNESKNEKNYSNNFSKVVKLSLILGPRYSLCYLNNKIVNLPNAFIFPFDNMQINQLLYLFPATTKLNNHELPVAVIIESVG